MRKNVSIVGSYDATPEEESLASELGGSLASLDCNIICGGRQGVMLRAAEGARMARDKAGGEGVVVGILPEADMSTANPFLDVAIPTGLGMYRNGLVAIAGDAVIAIGGGSGTLSEVSFAWMYNRPVAMLGKSGWAGRLGGEVLDHRRAEKLPWFSEVEEAIAWTRRVLDL